MSQTTKVHKIEIRNKRPGEVQTGASTEVLLDGKLFRGVTFIKFEAKAKGVAKCLVELYADVMINADIPVEVRNNKDIRWMAIADNKFLGFWADLDLAKEHAKKEAPNASSHSFTKVTIEKEPTKLVFFKPSLPDPA